MINRDRIQPFASILVGIGAIVLMAMAFGIWTSNWSIFIAISLFIVANMLREYSRSSCAGQEKEQQQ